MRYSKSWLLIIVISFIVVESLAGLIVLSAYHFFGTPKRISVFRFHPLLTGENVVHYELNWSETYPVFGYINRIHLSDECGYTTDKHGFIHNGDKARIIRPENFTIFILGGSTVAGHGSSCNNQTISAHLERLFQGEYSGIDVINAGVAGYHSPLEFLKLANEIIFYDPDIVITFGGTNDFGYKDKERFGRAHTYFIGDYHEKLYDTFEKTKSFWWSVKNLIYNCTRFTEYTYTRFVIQKGIAFLAGRTGSSSKSDLLTNAKRNAGIDRLPKKNIEYKNSGFEKKLDEKVSYFLTYIKEISVLARGMGAKYYYILQPILFTEQRELTEIEDEALNITRYSIFKKQGIDALKQANYFWQQVDSNFKDSNIDYYDFRGIFSNKTKVYSDHVHYTDNGNMIIAENLFKVLANARAIPDRLKRGGEGELQE